MRASLLAALLLAAAVAAPLQGARAEPFVDLLLGVSWTPDSELDRSTAMSSMTLDASWDESIAVGVRGGYWFEGPLRWLGVAGEIGYFQPETKLMGADLQYDVVTFTPLLMARLPLLTSEQWPAGRLQPYAAIGAAGFLAELNADDAIASEPESDFDVGADVRGGVAFPLRSWLTFFVEYRFTYFSVNQFVSPISGAGTEIGTDLRTHHLDAGFGFRF